MIKKKEIKLIIFALLIIVLTELSILQNGALKKSEFADLSYLANQIIEKCASSSYRPTCYDEQVPKLMDKPYNISLEEAFKITRIIQAQDSSFQYCHVLGHRLSSKEVAKNPQSWMNIIPRCPANGMCANGCLHGALQERFRSESLSDEQIETVIPDLQIACEARSNWNPTGLDQAICYHGLGHLTMYMTNADFEKSLEICDRIAKKDDGRDLTGVCYEGLFMQLFQPLEPEDFALAQGKEPKKDQLSTFCGQFGTKRQQQACWEEGWPLYREAIKTAEGIVNFCSRSPNPLQKDHCYDMIFHTVGQGSNFDADKITKLCNQIPLKRRGLCFASGALSMIQADKKFVDQATKFCLSAKPDKATDECYSRLADFATYNFHKGTEDLNRFCSGLPENLRPRCSGEDSS